MENQPKKPKILYAITKSTWGGAGRYVYDLATHFSAHNEVLVLLGGEGPLKDRLEEKGVRVISLSNLGRDMSVGKDTSSFFSFLRVLRSEKPDIVHLNSSKAGGLGALAARIAGVPKIIFTAHGWAFNEDRNPISKTLILFIHRLTVLLCHTTIAVSEQTMRDVASLPFVSRKVRVIHNAISSDQSGLLEKSAARKAFIEQFPQLAAAQTGRSEEPLWLGTTSELHPNKGLTHLIAALGRSEVVDTKRDLIAVIMGDGELRPALQRQIDEAGLDKKVFLLGHFKNASAYLKAFDILTLTSITEALPYSVLEAGIAGLPMIASSVGGIPEIISPPESGILVRPKDEDGLADAIALLIKDPAKRTSLGAALQKKVVEDFSLSSMLSRTEAAYKGLL